MVYNGTNKSTFDAFTPWRHHWLTRRMRQTGNFEGKQEYVPSENFDFQPVCRNQGPVAQGEEGTQIRASPEQVSGYTTACNLATWMSVFHDRYYGTHSAIHEG